METESDLVGLHNLPICRMTADLSSEKRGGSFHYRYFEFIKEADKKYCPVCNNEPAPAGQSDIVVNDKVWICGEYPGQGRLFGRIPPQMQIVNDSIGKVEFTDGKPTVWQRLREGENHANRAGNDGLDFERSQG
ncbi:MAG TPA: hypothetical protein PKA28_12395 [Methylomusa anaerophila]|uniref:Uncharacterized protein n=1 Tax=Methylomusa anaerophila TaxID=1930071 RepID=A0A348AF76_9FIRM|nr:hypothetical protein [Methylomusa anaerophila]BBB89724.1 hypothetical protein MAMMFC1_00358 [Methylomusa anaerophila]HML89231.1 hypothetical protein [Methylomusa anaerophila]